MASAQASSSLVGKQEINVDIKASAKKFYAMVAGRPDQMSKASPETVQGCHLQEGDWGKVGTIVFWNYVLEGKACVAKEVIEAVEPEKNSITYKVIEGDMMKEFKAFKINVQASPKKDGTGSTVRWTLDYEKINEEVAYPEILGNICAEVTKQMDGFLASSPDQA